MQVNSAEPSTSSSDGPSVRIPVDVRRFPWIRGSRPTTRTTSARSRRSSPAIRPIAARGPTRSRGRRRTTAGATRSPRSSRRSSSGAGAAARARRSRPAARRPPHRRHRHRPAGRAVRRPAVHAAQGAHRAEARRAGVARAQRAGGRGLLDRRRGPRLGRSPVVHGLRRGADAAHACRCRARAGAEPAPVATVRLDDSILDGARRARTHPAADRVPRRR